MTVKGAFCMWDASKLKGSRSTKSQIFYPLQVLKGWDCTSAKVRTEKARWNVELFLPVWMGVWQWKTTPAPSCDDRSLWMKGPSFISLVSSWSETNASIPHTTKKQLQVHLRYDVFCIRYRPTVFFPLIVWEYCHNFQIFFWYLYFFKCLSKSWLKFPLKRTAFFHGKLLRITLRVKHKLTP